MRDAGAKKKENNKVRTAKATAAKAATKAKKAKPGPKKRKRPDKQAEDDEPPEPPALRRSGLGELHSGDVADISCM